MNTLFLVHDASRFCRRKRKTNILKASLDEYGVRVVAVTKDFFVCLACGRRMASFIQGGRHENKYRCGTITTKAGTPAVMCALARDGLKPRLSNRLSRASLPG